MDYKVPLIMTPQPEGGYTVTSPLLPELITEGDTIGDTLENVRDALAAVIELYAELGRAPASEHADTGHKWASLVRDSDLDRVKYRDVARN